MNEAKHLGTRLFKGTITNCETSKLCVISYLQKQPYKHLSRKYNYINDRKENIKLISYSKDLYILELTNLLDYHY
jgi:hypothetical protein